VVRRSGRVGSPVPDSCSVVITCAVNRVTRVNVVCAQRLADCPAPALDQLRRGRAQLPTGSVARYIGA